MSKLPNLKKGKAKFAAAIIFALIVIILISVNFQKKPSTITLSGSQNKFYLSFNLTPFDRDQFSKFLEKLSLPQSIKDGITLNPETSSAAKLALFTPINAQIQTKGNSVELLGKLDHRPKLETISLSPFKVPDSTNLFIVSADLDSIVVKLPLPPNIKNWLSQSLNNPKTKQFILFGDSYAFVFEKDGVDFESLKNLEDEKGESIYKEETQGESKNYLLALPQRVDQKDAISIFQNGKYIIFVSSSKGAKEFQDALDEKSDNLIFPTQTLKGKPSFALMLKNPSQNQSNPTLYEVLFNSKQKFEFFSKVQTLYLTLANDTFSGIMNLK